MKTPSELSAALRAQAAKARLAKDTVSEAEIAAYVDGKLSSEQRERVQEAIALDPAAAELARDLALFRPAQSPDEPGFLTPQQLADDWQALRRRIGAAAAAADITAPRRSHGWQWLALAAALLVVSGVVIWGFAQRAGRREAEQRLAAALAPQVNVEPYTLSPAVVRGATPTEPPPMPLAVRGDAVWLRLAVLGRPGHESYRLEVRSVDHPEGAPLWTRDGLELYSDGSFSVAFPRAALPPGGYELRVVGVDHGVEHGVASYRIRLVPPLAPG
jgi:hypothetical protein